MLVYSTGIARNELIIMWICQRSAYFKFIPSTHTHTHILIPFEGSELTGLKVDIAHYCVLHLQNSVYSCFVYSTVCTKFHLSFTGCRTVLSVF